MLRAEKNPPSYMQACLVACTLSNSTQTRYTHINVSYFQCADLPVQQLYIFYIIFVLPFQVFGIFAIQVHRMMKYR